MAVGACQAPPLPRLGLITEKIQSQLQKSCKKIKNGFLSSQFPPKEWYTAKVFPNKFCLSLQPSEVDDAIRRHLSNFSVEMAKNK